MFDFYHKVSIWSRMEFIIDYTCEPRNSDMREVEPFGQAVQIDLIVNTSPYTCGLE